MKSVIITFLMFVVVFILLKFGALDLIDNNIFRIGSFILFCCVLGCAVYFVGIPDFKQLHSDTQEQQDENTETKQKNISKNGKKGRKKA